LINELGASLQACTELVDQLRSGYGEFSSRYSSGSTVEVEMPSPCGWLA
jgi:hypothetical protein